MFRVRSLILVLIHYTLFNCMTCLITTAPDATTCPTPNENCSCQEDISQNSMTIRCSNFESFPVFSQLKINNTNLYLDVSGTFSEIPTQCISSLVGEGTVAHLNISGSATYSYTKLQVDGNAFTTDYEKSIKVTFHYYDFSLCPTEALTVNNLLSVDFYNCQMTVIRNNSFSNFGGNELTLLESGIEEFEQYAFNGTGTLDRVNINLNPFSQINAAFKLIRTKALDLISSNISTIPSFAFCECNILGGCTNIIQTLVISYNPLVTIYDFAFENLPKLTSLSMVNCSLEKIPANAINAVPSLITIDLSYNQITEVEPNSFVNLMNLHTISLLFNPIIAIQPGAFDSLLWVSLDIFDFDNLESVDAAVTYGMDKVSNLFIINCPNFKEITVNNYTLLPDSLNAIYAPSLNIKSVSSNFDFWLRLAYAKHLDISYNYNYNCTSDLTWMRKYVMCPNKQIAMVNTRCADTNQLLEVYLRQLPHIPACVEHPVSSSITPQITTTPQTIATPSSATLLENSFTFFVLCTFFCFYLLT